MSALRQDDIGLGETHLAALEAEEEHKHDIEAALEQYAADLRYRIVEGLDFDLVHMFLEWEMDKELAGQLWLTWQGYPSDFTTVLHERLHSWSLQHAREQFFGRRIP